MLTVTSEESGEAKEAPQGPPDSGWVLSGEFLGKRHGNRVSKEELGECEVGRQHSLQGNLVSWPKVKAMIEL